ncbi:MAG: hypothetical protein AAGA23_23820 [Pseudomonadota bacterium]
MSRYEPGQDTLDRYVQQRLDDNEREQFEIWLLDHPEVLEDLKLRSAMRQGVKALGEDPVDAEPPKQPRWWERWLGSPAYLGATAMACLALMVTPAALYLAERQKTDSLEQALAEARQPKPVLQRVPLIMTRSAGDKPNATLELPRQPGTLLFDLSVRPWMDSLTTVEVTIAGAGLESRQMNLPIGTRGQISIGIGTDNLEAGLIEFVVKNEGRELVEYRVEIRD